MARQFKKSSGSRATLYDLFHKDPLAGKGIAKGEMPPHDFKNFFKYLGRHFGQTVSVNLLFVLANFPIFFLLLGFSGLFSDSLASPASSMFPVLFGQMQEAIDPVSAALFGVHGVQGSMTVTTTATKILYVLGALLIVTWGPVNVGTTYILRNMVKGDPIFFKHDFFYAIKRNLRQSFIMGFLDLLFIAVLGYDTALFFINMGYGGSALLFFASLLLSIVYMIMRFYIYIVLITFDLSIFKILKNAFIFVSLGIKRNLLAIIGITLLALIDYVILVVLLPLGVLLPFVMLYGLGAYMAVYAAWPKIKQYMIDPYPTEEQPQEEPVFKDDVSASEN